MTEQLLEGKYIQDADPYLSEPQRNRGQSSDFYSQWVLIIVEFKEECYNSMRCLHCGGKSMNRLAHLKTGKQIMMSNVTYMMSNVKSMMSNVTYMISNVRKGLFV